MKTKNGHTNCDINPVYPELSGVFTALLWHLDSITPPQVKEKITMIAERYCRKYDVYDFKEIIADSMFKIHKIIHKLEKPRISMPHKRGFQVIINGESYIMDSKELNSLSPENYMLFISDIEEKVFYKNIEVVGIQPVTKKLLICLLKNHKKLCDYTKIEEYVWEDTNISQGNLKTQKFNLVNNIPELKRYIKSRARKGYILKGDLTYCIIFGD